jgi:hypothetical protein
LRQIFKLAVATDGRIVHLIVIREKIYLATAIRLLYSSGMSEAEIREYLAKIGSKGGSVSSRQKREASKISLAKARRVRELQFRERAKTPNTKTKANENTNTKQGKKRSR